MKVSRWIVLLMFAGLAVFAVASAAYANIWTWSKNAGLEPKEPIAAYRVETSGLDVRVYEWEPVSIPGYKCIMAWGTDSPAGMQCMKNQ